MKKVKSPSPFLVHATDTSNVWSDGQAHLLEYRTLISKFDVEQRRPNAMIQQSRAY